LENFTLKISKSRIRESRILLFGCRFVRASDKAT
jgi:hypothetical protein